MSDIRILKVTADNFLTIRHAEIDFQNRGLTGVIGPNGSGKSALIVEAPCYSLFGVSERYGNRRDMLVNRFIGKDMHAGVELDVDGMNVKVDAYRKHHKFKDDVFLWINGEDKRGNSNDQTWEKIIKIIDMDYTAFTNAVVFGQSLSQYFSSLSDAAQKEIVERLLGITWIPQAYEIAKLDREECLSKIQLLENSLTDRNKSLIELEKQLKEYGEKFKEFEEEKIVRIKELENQFEKLVDTSQIEKKIKSLESRKLEVDEEIKGIDNDIGELDKEIISLNAELDLAKKEITKITTRINSLDKSKVGSICEFCGQQITEQSTENYIKHLKRDLSVLEVGEVKLGEKRKERNSIKEELKLNRKSFENKSDKYGDELNILKKSLETDRIKNARAEERNKALEKSIQEIKNSQNIYTELVIEFDSKVGSTKLDIEKIKNDYSSLSNELEYHRFWEEGFSNRGLKSFIIESVIPQMNQYANLYSSVLGGKYNISFSAQKQLKKGEFREKFYVDVENRVGSQSYEGNSNGERRAIDSIVMFVLGDLAASRSNKKFSLLILDDIFEKLDEEISDSIIAVLKMMVAGSEELPKRETIFVLTHLEYFNSKFENKIYMERHHGETIYREG